MSTTVSISSSIRYGFPLFFKASYSLAGTSGQTKMANWVRFTDHSGAPGQHRMAQPSIRSSRWSPASKRTPTVGVILSAHGMSPRLTIWRYRPVIPFSSFMWRTTNCPVSCTSAAQIYFSVCHLTSHRTHC